MIEREEYLRRLLCPLWLRPESALWYAHESFLVSQYLGNAFASPSLEVGCMEGTSTFVMLGGEFGINFDVYADVQWNAQSHQWKSLADDYFDTAPEEGGAGPDIVRRPAQGFSVGLSWKKAHLQKAARLGIYEQLVLHDPNQPLTMLAEESFETIWGPNLYWTDNLVGLLGELRRLLRPGGRLVTVLPDRIALDHLLYRFVNEVDSDWIKNLDRGRYSNIARQARTTQEWLSLFESTGLRVQRHEKFLPTLVLQVSDIGFRPLFPVLMNIYGTLRTHQPADWARIKEHWIQVAFEFLRPLCGTEWMQRLGHANVWNIFSVEKA